MPTRYPLKVPVPATCSICGSDFGIVDRGLAHYWRRSGRAICSIPCRQIARREAGKKGGPGEAGRARLSQQMKERNPMHDVEVRQRVSSTLRAIGHRPRQRGGNGHGLTEPQRQLAAALGWPTELVVRTGCAPTLGGLPTHYKLDLGNADLKVAVEIDGGSHYSLSRQEADERKDDWLRAEGWTVLRFKNADVLADLQGCAQVVLDACATKGG